MKNQALKLQEKAPKKSPDDVIGRRMRQVRKSMGLTLKSIAEKYGTSHPNIQRYEAGKVRAPLEYLYFLQGEGGVTVEWLLTGHESAPRAPVPAGVGEKSPNYKKAHLSLDEQELIDLYRAAKPAGRSAAKEVLKALKK